MSTAVGPGLGAVVRPAAVVDESTSLGEAWSVFAGDPDRCGVVLRGRTPIAVVGAGELAERWPGGGPRVSWATPVSAVLDRPLGVETIDPADSLVDAARRLVASGRPALPVLPVLGWPVRVLTVRDALAALLDLHPAP